MLADTVERVGDFLAAMNRLHVSRPVLCWTVLAALFLVAMLLLAHVAWSVRAALRATPSSEPRRGDLPSRRSLADEASQLAHAGRFFEAAHRMQLATIELLLRRGVVRLARHDPNRTLRRSWRACRRASGAATPHPRRSAPRCRSGGSRRANCVRRTRAAAVPAALLPCLDPTPFPAAGGTGVLFLPPGSAPGSATIAGVAVPAVVRPGEDARAQGEATSEDEGESGCGADDGPLEQRVDGALDARGFAMDQPRLRAFDSPDPSWTVRATVDGRPFVLERRFAAGRLVLVADASFLENEWLARGDAAPLVVALARRYGAPSFDERQHGLGPERSALG